VPGCLGPYLETPADWKAQRAALRQRAREAVARFEALYGDLPVEDWPEVLHRETYRNAKDILDMLGDEPPLRAHSHYR
jgi:hypothetical protein